ncbi:uncharacterized protein E0L32_010414 [Thyridium curvatum]|uniref:NAD-dependent epimerase/dehydratase domain-containing protein n=1 Tax=Thyridium curvatum TaxID=1093900 RepID=A0A507ASR8_9PEZI|nr:uncharacterized protein E0L32_010414 [Thyridium curvatum]TPX07959.1 hypothetical protein E0L32_010414 [Thyridium curvatum]
MPHADGPKLLLTGATGYVGGTVLHHLINSPNPGLKDVTISLLVRGEDRAQMLEETYGKRVECILFNDLDDTDLVRSVASQHDIIVNAASGFHPSSAEAMVRGLAERKKAKEEAVAAAAAAAAGGGQASATVWMIHTSGCSNISDSPITGEPFPDREWRDAEAGAVYEFERAENARAWAPQRAAELAVLAAGEELGVGATSLQAPLLFGGGEGLFRRAGVLVPLMTAYVLRRGHGFCLGGAAATAVIDWVHVFDLADLYVRCVVEVLERGGAGLPSGRRGIVFPTAGRTLIRDLARRCVEAARAAGLLEEEGEEEEAAVRTVDLAEAATTCGGDTAAAERRWAGHRKTVGTVARERLGWRPVMGDKAWRADFEDELQAALAGRRGVAIDDSRAPARGGRSAIRVSNTITVE